MGVVGWLGGGRVESRRSLGNNTSKFLSSVSSPRQKDVFNPVVEFLADRYSLSSCQRKRLRLNSFLTSESTAVVLLIRSKVSFF
jgi:hypothetical protein